MRPSFIRGTREPAFRRGSGAFGPALMPDDEKRNLARALLAEFGVTTVQERGHELIHSCCLPLGGHRNGDRNPSASLNWDKLTYNCLGCGASGGLLWFIALCRGETSDQARLWVEKQSGLTDDEEGLGALLRFIEAAYNHESTSYYAPIPRMDASVLKPWEAIHPWVTDPISEGGRGISRETAERFHVGYGFLRAMVGEGTFIDSERIVLPHFWKGDLVGWQSRRLNKTDGTPKYLSSPDFPKDTTIFNYDAKRHAVVVESQMSALSKYDLCPEMEATFGAKVTDRQIRLLSAHPQVTLWFDNDEAGWNATHRVAEALQPYCPVYVVPSTLAADPGDIADPELFASLLDARVPYQLWEQPRELEEVSHAIP